jgi:tetratricopeptide (TPR) repeat protein
MNPRTLPFLAITAILSFAWGDGRPCAPVEGPTPAEADDHAWSLLQEGRGAEAAEAFAASLAERPDSESSIEGRIRALIGLDRWHEALIEAREYRRRLPDSARVAAAHAEALFRAGRPWEAEPIVEELAAQADPPHRALLTLARLRAASGQSGAAAALIERALAAAPDDPELHFWGAEVAATRAEARARLERFLVLGAAGDPDRLEAARSTLVLFRALGERPVWVPVRRPRTLEVPLDPVRDAAGQLLGYSVRIRLGEKRRPVRVLLDSGSPGLFLTERIARRRGFEELSESTAFGGGGDKRHASNRGLFPVMTLGELEFADVLATTTAGDLESHGRYHGLMGLSIFRDYRVTLDLEQRKLILTPSDAGAGGSRYWLCSAQMLTRAASRDGHEGLFLFDTGAAWTILSTAFVEEIAAARLEHDAEVRGFGGRVEGARFVGGVELTFQQLTTGRGPLRAVDLSLRSRLSGVEVSGYLGLDLLEDARIVIDTGARRVEVVGPSQKR